MMRAYQIKCGVYICALRLPHTEIRKVHTHTHTQQTQTHNWPYPIIHFRIGNTRTRVGCD